MRVTLAESMERIFDGIPRDSRCQPYADDVTAWYKLIDSLMVGRVVRDSSTDYKLADDSWLCVEAHKISVFTLKIEG